MAKFIVVFEVNSREIDVGLEFPAIRWPLHVTFMTWQKVELARALKLLDYCTSLTGGLQVNVGQTEVFGDLHVSIVSSSQIKQLHQKALKYVEQNEIQLVNDRFVGRNYRAHITHQPKTENPKIGSSILLSRLCLVESFRVDGVAMRRVVAIKECNG